MATTTRATDLLFDPNFFENELRLNDQRCKILETMPHVTGGYEFRHTGRTTRRTC